MSIEEKAKRYDEALKQIKECTPDENGFITIYPQEIFPELKESEDERIRKRLIELVEEVRKANPTNADHNGMCSEAIAWLEKQGKNNMGISEATKKKLEDNLNKALEKETPESFNKFLDEQKPAWSEEDEEMHRKCICAMRASACGFPEEEKFVEKVDNWLKSLKPQNEC